jgi:2-keto-4-pentenoate hydratase/2-oxohepta-3-ene-1,7-dioic acid hydratase in catechol pathway
VKIISFKKDGAAAYGVVVGGGVIDAHARLKDKYPTVRDLLENGLDDARELLSAAPDFSLAAADLLPVIPDPEKIFCIGINYLSHLLETGRAKPDFPVVFTRNPRSQAAHGKPIIKPAASDQLDFEGELAVIIGEPGRNIAAADALAHVAGYSCYNDGSIRDWQKHTPQFTPGKNFDNTGGFGPWLLTADEVADPSTLELVTRLNGEEMQRAPLSDLVFDIPALIAYLSSFTTLVAGDVIVTGTTGGVGAFRNPPLWMKDGDVVEVEISSIGTLRNPVVAE